LRIFTTFYARVVRVIVRAHKATKALAVFANFFAHFCWPAFWLAQAIFYGWRLCDNSVRMTSGNRLFWLDFSGDFGHNSFTYFLIL